MSASTTACQISVSRWHAGASAGLQAASTALACAGTTGLFDREFNLDQGLSGFLERFIRLLLVSTWIGAQIAIEDTTPDSVDWLGICGEICGV
jgi:hypothetical protein